MKVRFIRLRCSYVADSIVEYTDDTEIIPKDSTVLARRLPASAPGKGRAARYVSGKPPVSAKPTTNAPIKAVSSVNIDKAMTEEEKLKAMLQLTGAQWQQKQEEMSHETRVHLQGAKPFNKKVNVPEGEPPHGYICYRCGKKGERGHKTAYKHVLTCYQVIGYKHVRPTTMSTMTTRTASRGQRVSLARC